MRVQRKRIAALLLSAAMMLQAAGYSLGGGGRPAHRRRRGGSLHPSHPRRRLRLHLRDRGLPPAPSCARFVTRRTTAKNSSRKNPSAPAPPCASKVLSISVARCAARKGRMEPPAPAGKSRGSRCRHGSTPCHGGRAGGHAPGGTAGGLCQPARRSGSLRCPGRWAESGSHRGGGL